MILVPSIVAGSVCLAAGLLSYARSPRSLAAKLFLLAMIGTFTATVTGGAYDSTDLSNTVLAKWVVTSSLLALSLLFELTLIFPIDHPIGFRPPNARGVAVAAMTISAVAIGLSADASPTDWLNGRTSALMTGYFAFATIASTVLLLRSRPLANEAGRRSATVFLAGLLIFATIGIMASLRLADPETGPEGTYGNALGIIVLVGVALAGILFMGPIVRDRISKPGSPVAERMTSSSKSKFKLEHRRVYLVEEAKPVYSMRMFTDILKGRCFDCENDESFACESLECNSCKLPCPCRECTKSKKRTQGLIVTRNYPKDIREKYFLQTTPVVWLSTVAGKDSTDPAKLNVLSDHLVNFMEKSNNGVVYVDGLEYLTTSNDFPRVLKAVDRWTETAMISSSSLILSFDPRAFDLKEVALLERNREVVRPDVGAK